MFTLDDIFAKITAGEKAVIPLFMFSPENQAIAGFAFVEEQLLFGIIGSFFHHKPAPAPVAAAPAPTPISVAPAA